MSDSEAFDATLFDTQDVTISRCEVSRRKIIFTMRASKSDLNLMKVYLALKDFVDDLQEKLNILDDAEGEH